jgi:pimeloyl-ACP methyl ester carboxylesterase
VSNELRVHLAVSRDGTEVAGRVVGQGPPLVFLPAGPADSETSWRFVVPLLRTRFTCYLVDTRGRGLSASGPDHSPERLAEDVTAFIAGIGAPVGLVGWGTALWASVASDPATRVSAVAAYEPGAYEVLGADDAVRIRDVFARVGALAAAGDLVNAARTLVANSDPVYTAEEVAEGAPGRFWEAAAMNIQVFLREHEQAGAVSPTAPAVLAAIGVPVLLLHGSRSKRWFVDSIRHIAAHIPDARPLEITGADHFAPYTDPAAVADELIRFFEAALDKRITSPPH